MRHAMLLPQRCHADARSATHAAAAADFADACHVEAQAYTDKLSAKAPLILRRASR